MSSIEKFKECMRTLPTGVTVITTESTGGHKEGATINTIASLSLSPLLIMFGIKKSSFFYKNFLDCKYFTVNILSESQQNVSDAFTKLNVKKWKTVTLLNTTTTNSPAIAGTLAFLECKNHKIYDGGDHSIMVGKVVNAVTLENKKPLVYFNSKYAKLQESHESI